MNIKYGFTFVLMRTCRVAKSVQSVSEMTCCGCFERNSNESVCVLSMKLVLICVESRNNMFNNFLVKLKQFVCLFVCSVFL